MDISTPPQRSGSDWTFEDLELDPYVQRDGTYGIDDEVEFIAACQAGLITSDERITAERTVAELRGELAGDDSLLLTAGVERLASAIELDLEPLLTVRHESS